jgi:hypothetical protein
MYYILEASLAMRMRAHDYLAGSAFPYFIVMLVLGIG